MTKLIVPFRNFANAPESVSLRKKMEQLSIPCNEEVWTVEGKADNKYSRNRFLCLFHEMRKNIANEYDSNGGTTYIPEYHAIIAHTDVPVTTRKPSLRFAHSP